jgi:hypothetical protein
MIPLCSIGLALPGLTLPAVLALEPRRAGDPQDLAALVPEAPALWIEVPDMDRATAAIAETSLGKLVRALSEEIDPAEIAMQLDLPEEALERGATGGVRGLLLGLALDLGLSEERAQQWAESLGGSLALARWERPDDAPPLSGLALAATLREGASTVLAGEVLSALEGASGPWAGAGIELLELARSGDETRAVWGWESGGDLPAGYFVVRPGLAACTFERDLAELLSAEKAPEPAESSARERFEDARAASRERGELVWLRLSGEELERAGGDPQARAWLTALDLDDLAVLELGLTTAGGQIRSRLRIEPREMHARERAGESGDESEDDERESYKANTAWSTLDVLPSDTIAALGLARSPRTLAALFADIWGSLGDPSAGTLLARLAATPLFGRLAEPGALAEETLLFARSGGPGLPQFYAAVPNTPALDKIFGSLAGRAERDLSLGQGLLLRQRPLMDGEAWVFYRGAPDAPRSFLALTRSAEVWVASDVSAQLQGLLRQRSRERLAVREEGVRALRSAIAAEVAHAGASPRQLAAFLHVRSGPLIEQAWPFAHLALQWFGAVEDLESLPDPLEIAELIGDTTIVALELEGAVEIRGRGLLGGLALLF